MCFESFEENWPKWAFPDILYNISRDSQTHNLPKNPQNPQFFDSFWQPFDHLLDFKQAFIIDPDPFGSNRCQNQ